MKGVVNMILKFQFTTLASCEMDNKIFYVTINSNGTGIQWCNQALRAFASGVLNAKNLAFSTLNTKNLPIPRVPNAK